MIINYSQAGIFDIDNVTGAITVERELDVETMPTQYSLTVIAMDGAQTPMRYLDQITTFKAPHYCCVANCFSVH